MQLTHRYSTRYRRRFASCFSILMKTKASEITVQVALIRAVLEEVEDSEDLWVHGVILGMAFVAHWIGLVPPHRLRLLDAGKGSRQIDRGTVKRKPRDEESDEYSEEFSDAIFFLSFI